MANPTPVIAKRFDALKLYAQAGKAFTEAGAYHVPKREKWVILLAQVAQLSMAIREYAIMTVEDIEPIWAKLRALPHMTDVINYAIADLTMIMDMSWDDVADALSEATRAILAAGNPDALNAMDVPFHESFTTESNYAALLRANRWMVMLMLLRRSGIFNLVNRQVAETPAEPAPPVEREREGNFNQGG